MFLFLIISIDIVHSLFALEEILREEDAQMQYAQMMMDDDHDWMDIEDNIQPAKKSKKRPKSSTPTSKKSKKFKSNLTATPITNWV